VKEKREIMSDKIMSHTIKKGSYIKWGEGADQQRGLVISVSGDSLTVVPDGKKSADATTVQRKDARLSRIAAMKNKIGVNIVEVVENVTIHGIIQRVMKRDFFGPDSMSFAMADLVYELGLKEVLSPFSDLIADRMVDPADEKPDSFFKSEDWKDMARKVPFTFILTALMKKFVYKQKFFSHAVSNLASQAGALYTTNVLDRNARYSPEKGYQYP
jgi:hypothetical protein